MSLKLNSHGIFLSVNIDTLDILKAKHQTFILSNTDLIKAFHSEDKLTASFEVCIVVLKKYVSDTKHSLISFDILLRKPQMPRKKKEKAKVSYLIPQHAIDKIEHILTESPEYKVKAVWRQKYYYLIDYIIQRTHFDSDKILGKDYVNIHSKRTANILSVDGRQMNNILRRLKSYRVLKCDGKMQQETRKWIGSVRVIDKKGKSFGYTIIEPGNLACLIKEDEKDFYTNSQLTECSKSLIIDEKLRAYHDILLKLGINEKEWNDGVQKIIESKKERKHIMAQYKNHLKQFTSRNDIDDYIYTPIGSVIVPGETEIESDATTLARCEQMNFRIKHHHLLPVRYNQSRVHTPITSLYRELRRALLLNGKRLIGVDIRNSQPLIACILIRDYWMKEHGHVPDDVKEYQKSCEEGHFYDHFMEQLNIPDTLRSAFKADFFAKVYFSKENKTNNILKTMFKRKYPNVWQAIYELKGGIKTEKYAEFAKSLQKKEAEIIFDNVNIGLINKGINALNVYDAIYVTDRNELATAIRMLRKAFSAYGLNPTFNYEYRHVIAKCK